MTVLRTQLSGLARRPARLLLTGLAMLVASFVVYGTVLAQYSTARTVVDGLSGTPEAADVVVGSVDKPVPAPVLDRIRALPGVAEVTGRAYVGFSLRAPAGSYLTVGADPGSGPLATARLIEGAYPDAPHEVALSRRTADWFGIAVAGVAKATTDGGKPVNLTVTGVVEDGNGGAGWAYTTDRLIGALGPLPEFNQVEVRLKPGATIDQVRDVVGAAAPVETGARVRQDEATSAASGVKLIFALVGVFVAIAVAAAALVATSTFRIVFAQRMRQLALLRAVGAGRGAIVRALAVEGALTGLVSGVVGVLAAYAFGRALPAVLRASGVEVADPGTPVGPAIAVVVGCVLVTLLAVLAPAGSASRVSPLEALRAASTTGARSGIGVGRAILGGVLAAGAALLAAVLVAALPGPDARSYDPAPVLFGVVLSSTLAFFALVALGPVLLGPVLRLVGWPLRRAGALGRLAVGGVGGAPRRAAAVSVVVALGVAMISGGLIMGESLRRMADREMAAMAPADFRLSPAGDTLPAGVAERVRKRSEVTDVTTFRTAEVRIVGTEDLAVSVADLDPRKLRADRRLGAVDGSLDDLGPGRVALARYVGAHDRTRVGDTIQMAAAGRTVSLRVVATLESGPLETSAMVDPADLDRLGVPAAPTGLLANAARAGDDGRASARTALQSATGAEGLTVAVLADQRDDLNANLNALIGIAIGLMGLTVLIAVVGVGSTTALSVVERIREAGLLRALGMARGGLRAMLTAEAALYGILGSVLGLALGIPYAGLMIAGFGEGVPLELPAGQLVLTVLALTGLTALAGVLPARRAAKVSPMAAIAQDG
ncbi:FtsX-like permease family protein [Micromonospora sp. CPCC 205371]|nr:FtsX-like permease family protein [Micromonospora sp. CPCC 205371]